MSTDLTNKQAFEALFRQHYALLVGYALRMVRDKDLAEDLVQQVFVTLWEKREETTVNGEWRSYLMRAVHNRCLNHFKHEGVRAEHAQESLHHSASSHDHDPLEAAELSLRVNALIEDLPEQCRKVFLLSRREGKKYQEIADELGISIKTVENQMGKALKLMREGLKNHVSGGLRALVIIFWLIVGVEALSIVISKQ